MNIPRAQAAAFYRGLVNLAIKARPRPPPEKYPDAVYSFLGRQRIVHQLLAMAALDLGFPSETARAHLAEAAACSVLSLERTGRTSALEALQTFSRIGACGDRRAAATSTRRRGGAAADGWRAMVSLASEALTAARPDPVGPLAEAARLGRAMLARDVRDLVYEAWFAEAALSFAAAAAKRGWRVPDDDPHPATPLALFRLPPVRLPARRFGELPPIDPELARAIARAAKRPRP